MCCDLCPSTAAESSKGAQVLMLLLHGLQDNGDDLDVGISHSIVDLVWGGSGPPGSTLGVHDIILQLPGVAVDLLQQVSPAAMAAWSVTAGACEATGRQG